MSWLSSLKSVFSPAQEVKEDEIQTVLQNYVLPHSENALKDRISQVNVQGRILQLTVNTFPEEKDIKMATEGIKAARKINPRLILDLFRDHVHKDCAQFIYARDMFSFRQVAQKKIASQFNEMISALAIFDKHWDTMGQKNQEIIWQYLTVLCRISEKEI